MVALMKRMDSNSPLPSLLPRRTPLVAGLAVTLVLPGFLASCGKKEPKAEAAPAVSKPAAVAAPAPVPVPTEAEAPKSAPSVSPSAAGSGSPKTGLNIGRNPADAGAWQRWDHTAAGLREMGITVRPSEDPQHMEIVAGPRMTRQEARLVVKNIYRELGGRSAIVTLYNESGIPLAEATFGGVQ